MLRVGVAGVPGAWSTELMAEALRKRGIETFTFSLGDCVHDLNSGRVKLGDRDLGRLDGVVIKKLGAQPSASIRLRLHMLRALEHQGVRIYSRPSAIERAMDRYRMHMELVRAGLPVPYTFSCEGEDGARTITERLGAAVVKPVYTSKGRGMTRVNHHASANVLTGDLDGRMLIQQFIEGPGRDIGACVLGGQFVSAFYRVAKPGEWMTTTAAGGAYAPCHLDRRGMTLAEEAASVFGLDYTVVDLVEAPPGYRIYEVSAFGGFRGLWEACGIDTAAAYASYIRRTLNE